MPLHIIVTAKQVIDPDMPLSAFRIDAAGPTGDDTTNLSAGGEWF